MKKILGFVFVVLLLGFLPNAFSHAETLSMDYIVNGTSMSVEVIGLGSTEKDDDEEIKREFASNFMLTLLGVITSVMAVTVSIVYKEEIKNMVKIK